PRAADRILAPAKINLYLHVVGRRADGMHLLDSLVVFAGIGDDLTVSPAEELALAIDGPFGDGLTADADHLVLRAAYRLQVASAAGRGPSLRLTKRLPIASGIGGGSADAAAALKLLAQLWCPALGSRELVAIGEAIGADVAVCLAAPRPSLVGGIGERLE